MKASLYLYFKRKKKQTKPYSKSWVRFTNSLLSELVHIKYIAWHHLQKTYWTSHLTPLCALDISPSTLIHWRTLTDHEPAEGQMNAHRVKIGWAYNSQKKKLHGRNTADTSRKDHKEDAFKYKYKATLRVYIISKAWRKATISTLVLPLPYWSAYERNNSYAYRRTTIIKKLF